MNLLKLLQYQKNLRAGYREISQRLRCEVIMFSDHKLVKQELKLISRDFGSIAEDLKQHLN